MVNCNFRGNLRMMALQAKWFPRGSQGVPVCLGQTQGVGQMEVVGQTEGVGVGQTGALNQSPLLPPGVVCVVYKLYFSL